MNAAVAPASLDALQRAAESGGPDDALRLAMALIDAQRMPEAQAWLLRAAEAGHPHAQVEYARMRLYGMAGAPALDDAAQWLLRAEKGGH